jgi:outer membrane protein assembly factor BamE (lipoprotein component of BamABCDE complex)
MNSNRPHFSFANHSRILPLTVLSGLIVLFVLFLSGCATVGKDFPVTEVTEIEIGKTTQKEIRAMFGSPWRTGIEDGKRTWTYGTYSYGLFSAKKAKDLVIRFDGKNVVVSYTFSTTEHNE